MCGDTREHAMLWLQRLERDTGPGGPPVSTPLCRTTPPTGP